VNGDLSADLRRILGIQAVRAFLYGFGAVILGATLAAQGASDLAVGVLGAAILAGMAISAITVGVLGDRWGRRRTYGGLLLLMGIVGAAYAATDKLWILIVLALLGVLSTDANENGPLTTLEQAMIGQAPGETRLRVFGRYNAVAYVAGAGGSLSAAAVGAARHATLVSLSTASLFAAFPVAALACAAIALTLKGDARTGDATARPGRVLPGRRLVALSSLFAVDAFGGGFVTQAFIAYWLSLRFGATPAVIGVIFFVTGLLQAGSSIAAARLAARAGVLNVMVFTHIPSNILLAAVALAPSLPVAVVLLLARFALSQMDVPARQAFVAGIVPPDERLSAAAYTNVARYAGRPLGPAIGGLLMRLALGAPFLAAGLIKLAYDITLYAGFRDQAPAAD